LVCRTGCALGEGEGLTVAEAVADGDESLASFVGL
jgi:hypothetical protein